MLTITNIDKLSEYVIKVPGTPSFRITCAKEFATHYEIRFQQNTRALHYEVELGRELEYGEYYGITCHALAFKDHIPAVEMSDIKLVLNHIAKFLPLTAPIVVKIC